MQEALATNRDWLPGGFTDSSEISDDMLPRRSPSPRLPRRQLSSGVCALWSSDAVQHQ